MKRVKKLVSMFLILLTSGTTLSQDTIQTGRELFEQRDYNQALAFFERNKRAMQGDAQFYYYYGLSLYKKGASKQAVDSLELANKLFPDNSAYRYALGLAYLLHLDQVNFLKKPFIGKRILPSLEQAVALDSHNYPAQSYYLRQLIFMPGMAGGDLPKAKQLVGDLSRQDSAWAAFVEAMIAIKEQRDDEVVGHFHMATEGNTIIPEAVFWLASYLEETGLPQSALAQFSKYVTLDLNWYDPDIWEAYYHMGNIHKEAGNHQLAQDNLALALQHAPNESVRKTVTKALNALEGTSE